jgi:hypothetical protein
MKDVLGMREGKCKGEMPRSGVLVYMRESCIVTFEGNF